MQCRGPARWCRNCWPSGGPPQQQSDGLDASAVLALINDEPGVDLVADNIAGSRFSTVNLAEIVGKLVDAGLDAGPAGALLTAAGVLVEPFLATDGELAGALRSLPAARALSLGDRCCPALALRQPEPVVLTADRAWAGLDLPLTIRLLR